MVYLNRAEYFPSLRRDGDVILNTHCEKRAGPNLPRKSPISMARADSPRAARRACSAHTPSPRLAPAPAAPHWSLAAASTRDGSATCSITPMGSSHTQGQPGGVRGFTGPLAAPRPEQHRRMQEENSSRNEKYAIFKPHATTGTPSESSQTDGQTNRAHTTQPMPRAQTYSAIGMGA